MSKVSLPGAASRCLTTPFVSGVCKFGPAYARALRRRQGRRGDIWHVDEVFISIRGERRYLWRAVDPDGDVLDILVTRTVNSK